MHDAQVNVRPATNKTADLAILEAHPFCRLLQYFGAPLQCGALASVEIWHEGLDDAAGAEHAWQGKGHTPHALALRRQHGAGQQRPLVVLNSLRDAGKTGARLLLFPG